MPIIRPRRWNSAIWIAIAALGGCASNEKSVAREPVDAGGRQGGDPIPAASTPTSPVDAGAVSVDAGPPKPTRVPMFVAQGKLGRTTISCDDGKTWIADHSEVPTARCWDDTAAENIECDHNKWSSVGIIVAGDYFLATYGWGYPGVVRRSEDGVTWEDVFPGHTFAGLSFGNGRVFANDRAPWTSTTFGAAGSWQQGGSVESPVWNVRRSAFVPVGNGRFVISLESGDQADIVLSDDNGTTWRPATTRPAECARQVGRILHGNGVTVMSQANGSVCRSTDGGETWSHVPVSSGFSSDLLFANGTFLVWEGNTQYSSADAATWTTTAGSGDVSIGAVAQGPSGTFVAVRAGWQVWYEKQRFYRSTDGLAWEVLPETAFVHGHPITNIVAGWAKPSATCPLPP